MSGYRREAFKAASMVLLAVLLGVVIYHSFPPRESPLVVFGLVWLRGEQSGTSDEGNGFGYDLAGSYDLLEFEFIFANGSWTGYSRFDHVNESYRERFLGEQAEFSRTNLLGYKGEFDAEGLEGIVVRPLPMIMWDAWVARKLSAYAIEIIRNYRLDVALETAAITDLGTYQNLKNNNTVISVSSLGVENYTWTKHRGEELWSGYWTPPRNFTYEGKGKNSVRTTVLNDWVINVGQLTSMLEGSGTAFITFNLSLSVNTKYNVTVPDVQEVGETSLLGEGNLGTIKISYDQGEILWISYDFSNVKMIMRVSINNGG